MPVQGRISLKVGFTSLWIFSSKSSLSGVDQPLPLCPLIRSAFAFEVEFDISFPNGFQYHKRPIQSFEDIFDTTFQLVQNNIKRMGILKMTKLQAVAIPALTSLTFDFLLEAPELNGTSTALCSVSVLKLSKRTGGCAIIIVTSTPAKAWEIGNLMKNMYKNAFEFYLSDGKHPGIISEEIYVADITTFADDMKNGKLITDYSTIFAIKDISEEQFNTYNEYLRFDSPYFSTVRALRI